MEEITYDSIWDLGQNCTSRRYNILLTEGNSINGPFSWGIATNPLVSVKILANPELHTFSAQDLIYNQGIPMDKRSGYMYCHQFDNVDGVQTFEESHQIIIARLTRRFNRVLQELNNPEAKPLFTWIGYGAHGLRWVNTHLETAIPATVFSVDLAKEVLQYLHDHFPADSRLLYFDYNPEEKDGYKVEYSDDHLLAIWHTIDDANNTHTAILADYFLNLIPNIPKKVHPVPGYSIERLNTTDTTKFVHLLLIFEDGKPVRHVLNLRTNTGHSYEIDTTQYKIDKYVPDTRLSIVWKESDVQYDFIYTGDNTYQLTHKIQLINCKHTRWGETPITMKLDLAQSSVSTCKAKGKRGSICVFKEKQYVIIYWDDKRLEQFVYRNGAYAQTPFTAKKATKRVLIGILTNGATWRCQEGQKATWLKRLPECCDYKYFFSKADIRAHWLAMGQKDTLKLNTSTTDPVDLLFAFFAWALRQPYWEWLVYTQDNCWIDSSALLHYLIPTSDAIFPHDITAPENMVFTSDACECFRRSVIDFIVKHRAEIRTHPEINTLGIHGVLLHQGFVNSFRTNTLPSYLHRPQRKINTAKTFVVAQPDNKILPTYVVDWMRQLDTRIQRKPL